ncbi:hypothetical protein EZV62_022844 [Acer yangbiense]|uniref:Alpha-1,2-Mannosidase n=1 Tax=Acer yangbiense TaxID=1000413 RepID=A0A5C7GZV6_9ROSI|nr:hypothetical protein EZV62_022844 [Acer yangbiense]
MNMLPCILQTWVLVFLVISPTLFAASDSRVDLYSSARKRRLREKYDMCSEFVFAMDDYSRFYHAYENYSTHAFPCSIRVLGGLVSAHILATDSASRLFQGSYKNQRFGTSFNTPTGLAYAWKYGVIESETTETSTSRYHEADMKTGKATYWQLTSLHAFWPGLQASYGWGYCCCQFIPP